MRMRYRAETKDVIIFTMFAIIWLFVVALAVTNVYEFLNGNSFTINILIAFSKTNIAVTLIFFVIGLVFFAVLLTVWTISSFCLLLEIWARLSGIPFCITCCSWR